jgi:SAM-dependent methyltransferase
MNIKSVLDNPAIYLLWQAPFAAQKMAPVVNSESFHRARSVLDVGCGPGTNTGSFNGVPVYLGVDLDERYVAYARRRHGREFRVADVTSDIPSSSKFDLILMNSLMHHLDDAGVAHLLGSLPRLLSDNGEIHILDLVLAERGLPRNLALADQGQFPRTIPDWRDLVGNTLEIRAISPFHLTLAGMPLWEMVHISAGVKNS